MSHIRSSNKIRLSNRVFAVALAASCLVNLIAWCVIGLIWRPSIGLMNAPSGRIVHLASLVPLPHSPKPPATPVKTPPVVHPRLPRNSRQHAHHASEIAQIVSPVPARAKSSGGSRPAPRIAARVAPRSAPKAVARPTPVPVQVAALPEPETATVVIKREDSRATSLILPAAPVLPAVQGPVSAPSGQGAGTGSGGQGTGQGTGVGSGQSNGGGGGSPGLFGLGDLGGGELHIVYVLDASLSMSSRIDRARDELTASLDSLGPGESFNIIVFGGGAYLLDRGLLPATPENKRRAGRFLDQVDLMSGTNLGYALDRALSQDGVNTVVLLTDGVPTEGETNFSRLAAKIREDNAGHARIYTVGLVGRNPDGTDDSFDARTLLTEIARESGGKSKLATVGDATPD